MWVWLMDDLIKNIDNIHTTKLGVERIKKNLDLDADIVDWCGTKIGQADEIIRKGKNWYVHVDNFVITINAHSYTIITAHKRRRDRRGSEYGDHGVAAEQDGKLVGMAWTRIIPAYGHIDNKTPELAISVLPEYRGHGIGTMLMTRQFDLLREHGYSRTSLSVQKDNPAVRFYKRLGYKITDEKLDHVGHEDYIMLKELGVTLRKWSIEDAPALAEARTI